MEYTKISSTFGSVFHVVVATAGSSSSASKMYKRVIQEGMNGLLELNYPYFTEKGKEFYQLIKQQISELVKSEIDLLEETSV